MLPQRYKERYKMILQKALISKEDLKEFREAVSHYTVVFPDWKKKQFF
jgi:hypothetical protein